MTPRARWRILQAAILVPTLKVAMLSSATTRRQWCGAEEWAVVPGGLPGLRAFIVLWVCDVRCALTEGWAMHASPDRSDQPVCKPEQEH